MKNNDKSYCKTNKNKKLTAEKKVEFFIYDKIVKKEFFEEKQVRNEIISYCKKNKAITHIRTENFIILSAKSVLIKKTKKKKTTVIAGNLFEFVNIDLKTDGK